MAPTRIAFQGEHGAFSEEAALSLRPGAETVPQRTFEDVVKAVEDGSAGLGLLPVENTLAGGVVAAYDALAAGVVRVTDEVVIPIRHFAMGVPGGELDELREVRSHPVALAQCRAFLSRVSWAAARAVHDTAGAARDVAALGDPAVAAIAPRGAARRYGLDILAADVQDRDDNQTRFLLVEPERARVRLEASGHDPTDMPAGSRPELKSALVVETKNRPGALRDLLDPFAEAGFDLAFVESRPTGVPWTYRFVIEFRHGAHLSVRSFVEDLLPVARRVDVLGTFPAARP